MTGFTHDMSLGTTTLSEIMRVRSAISANRFFGCFAYGTRSGLKAFELSVGKDFWKNGKSRWLFSIDRGRTDPNALRAIAKRPNAKVRIYDGRYVVDRDGFLPRRYFHPKVTLVENAVSGAQGLVLGSGNFSSNGLQHSVEAGWAVIASSKAEVGQHIQPVRSAFETLWNTACPLDDIIDRYETLWTALPDSSGAKQNMKAKGQAKRFWIEAGYVTENRTYPRPGNQIFAPKGFGKFFGLGSSKGGSTLIGTITFETPVGPRVTMNYRDNGNTMEKLALPYPEEHGFGVYDGKVLIFEPRGSRFLLTAVETADFKLAYGHRLANVGTMLRGRRFGELI